MTYPSDLWTAQKAPKKRKVGRPKGKVRPIRVLVCVSQPEFDALLALALPGEAYSASVRRLALAACLASSDEIKQG